METPANNVRKGLLIGVIGIVILSPDALLLRLFDGDDLTAVAGRAVFMAIGVGVIMLFLPALRAGFQWRPVLLYSAIYTVGMVSFPLSVRHTHVANTLVIMIIAPLLAAIGARVFLSEEVTRRTWLACATAAVGTAIVFAPQTTSGGLLGNVLALGVALSLAGCSIVVRRYPHTMMFPGLFISAIFMATITVPFADWQLSPQNFAILVVNGGLIMSISFVCIIAASRLLSPPEVNLLFLLETVLAPLWVWLVLAEKPPVATVAGGTLIAGVLTAHFIATLKEEANKTI